MAYKHPQLSDNPYDANYWLRRKEQDKAKAKADKLREEVATGKKPKINRTCRIRFVGNKLPMTTIYCSAQVIRRIRDITIIVEQNIRVPMKGKNRELVSRLYELAYGDNDYRDPQGELLEHFTQPGREILALYANSL